MSHCESGRAKKIHRRRSAIPHLHPAIPATLPAWRWDQGPDGPYYNLQGREQGKTVSRYVPRDQVEAVAEHIANHRKFMAVVEEYTEHVIEQTRRERLEGSKKKTLPPPSSWRRAKKSKT